MLNSPAARPRKFSLHAACLGLAALASLAGCKPPAMEGGPPPGFAIGVIVAPATEKPVTDRIELVGTLAANERVEIKSEVSGKVKSVGFAEGDEVKAGQVLFEIDPEKLSATATSAQADFAMAEMNFKRIEQLQGQKAVSQQEYDQARQQNDSARAMRDLRERELRDATIRAPFDGVAGARLVSPGQYVATMNASTPLTTLVDLDPLKADFSVPERFISTLKKGQAIKVRVAAYPGEDFTGEVYFIAPEVDEKTRTIQVRAKVANADRRLKPGMFASLGLVINVREKALTIPETALIQQAELSYVMLATPEGVVEMRPVKVGLRMENEIEITEGLKAGETVITEGHQKVGPGSKVEAKLKK